MMRSVKITRKVDELGRIVIPSEIRKHLGIEQDTILEVELCNNDVIIRKAEDTCRLCGSVRDLRKIGDTFICRECANEIKKTVY